MYLSGTKYCSLLLGCLLSLSLQAKEKKTIGVGQSLQKPFTFIENNGQITGRYNKPNTDIQYKLSTPGMNLLVGAGHLYYQFRKVQGNTENPTISTHNMEVTLVGASTHGKVTGSEPQEYFENYFVDRLSKEGITAHSFNKITYKDVYPNIDWVIYVKNNKVEYDFVVRPGGDVKNIKLQYGGASSLAITKDGGISAETPMGKVEEQKPYSYEAETGKEIASSFVMHNNIVTFEAAPHTGTLTIDPYILWSTYLGKTGEDVVTSVAVSTTSQIYVGGYTSSNTAFGFGAAGIWDLTYNGGTYDAFAAKYNNAGSLQWCTYFGGNNLDRGTGIALDNTGTYVYLCGSSTSTPVAGSMATIGAFRTTNAGGSDAFLAKFTTAAGSRVWASFWGGTSDDYANGIAIDAANNVYITGQTASTGIATAGKYQTTRSGTNDAFIAKFNGAAAGAGALIWATYYGGTAQENAYSIAVDPTTNDLLVTGQTNSVVNIASAGAYQSALSGTNDAFILRIDSAGVARRWGTYFGGSGQEQGNGIACASSGRIAVVGNTTSASNIATANAYDAVYDGGPQDAFVSCFNAAGNIVWSTYYGGTQPDYAESVTIDANSNILVAGGTFSSNGIASPAGTFAAGGFQGAIGGDYDAFVSKFNPLGQLLWGTYFGNALYDYGNAIAFDRTTEQIVLGGYTTSITGIATAGVTQTTYGGGVYDGFVTKLKKDTILQIVQPYIDTLVCQNGSFTVSYNSNVVAYQAGNVFTLEMSNAAGSFASPVTLGTLASTAGSGTVTGIIPGSALGTGYRVRIRSSNPVYISPDDYLNIQVVPSLTPATALANTPVCVGNDLVLRVAAPYTIASYSWTGPGSISGATSSTASVFGVTAADAGTYSVTTTHNGCPATVSTVSVTVNSAHPPMPAATTITPNCAGSTISLFGNSDTTVSGITYFWSGPAGFTSTLQNPTIAGASAANTGTYFLTDTMAGCQSPVASVFVDVLPVTPATVTISVSPNDTVCQGTMVNFVATPVNGGATPAYQWMSGPGTPIVGAISGTFSSPTLTNGETVFVVMSSSVTCPFPAHDTSNKITMNVISNPPVVYITANPGTSVVPGTNVILSSIVYNGGVNPTYQWMLNGRKISGATTSTYTLMNVRASDSISLNVKSTMMCATPDSGISNNLVVRPNTGISAISSALDGVVLYPNPNSGSFMLKGEVGSNTGTVNIAIANLLGQVVYAGTVNAVNNTLETSISMQQLPAGVYLLRMSDGGVSKTIRFTVQY